MHLSIDERRAEARIRLAQRSAIRTRVYRQWRVGTITQDEARRRLSVILEEARA